MNPNDNNDSQANMDVADNTGTTPENAAAGTITTETDAEQNQTGLELFVNEQGNRLTARFKPGPQVITISVEAIRQIVAEQGFSEDDFPLFEDRLNDLSRGIEQRRSFEIEIGGPVDSEIHVYVSPDQTLAGVEITPPMGKGLPPSREAFDQAMQKNRILRGIDTSLVDQLFSAEGIQNITEPCCYLVAFGQKPKDGADGELTPLIEEMSERRPLVLKGTKDQVDFRELGDFPVLPEETPLFKLTEPVPGEDGFSVSGKILKAYHGKEKKIKQDPSIRPDYADRRIYVAAIKGMPVFTDQGIHIENTLQIDEVSIASGNIRFDGSVQVKRGVNPGMLLEATGDIKIGGLVDNSTVISGGNIEIAGGIIGQKSPNLKADQPTKENAVVRAKGNIKARFIQDAWVESNASIMAQKLIMHSRLWASNSVKLSGAGQLVGGHVLATDYIEAGQLGTLASVPTILEVGPLDAVRDEMSSVQQKLKEGAEQAKQLKELINRIREEKRHISPEKKEQIIKARDTTRRAMIALEQRRQELEQEIHSRRKARVKALKKAYSGCNIVIADTGRVLKEDFGKTTFYLESGEILLR
ncbi:FapA family protein [Oceanospirillum sp.]|uniref:DUF342 domain-containing protein n=1 Tax=Oceanospirillum sp. TaxID=2021254 RepID=UPI003A92DE2C